MERIYTNIILAILPVYENSIGDCTRIMTLESGDFIIDYKIDTIIRQLAKYYMIDLNQVRSQYKKFIGMKNLIPLAFNKENIFIPLKTRQPKYKNDRAFSYINLAYIQEVLEEEDTTYLALTNGRKVKCLCKKSTVKKHISNGWIVKNCYIERSMPSAPNHIDRDRLGGLLEFLMYFSQYINKN